MGMKSRFSEKNKVCLWLSFFSAAVAFFYSLFILAHIDHDCVGEDCALCGQLRLAGDFLRRIEWCVGEIAFFLASLGLLPVSAQPDADFLFAFDPVSLKVRLNN
jgi:hypothetical protein